MPAKRIDAGNSTPSRPPALSPEIRELELQSAAYDLAEKQLREGTASAQVIVHFLKADAEKSRLERERLHNANLLDQAKVEAMASSASHEALLREAMRAFTEYRGGDVEDDGY